MSVESSRFTRFERQSGILSEIAIYRQLTEIDSVFADTHFETSKY